MNLKMAEELIKRDCFEAVMTAMRGPDSEDTNLKRQTTSVLRWAVGFDYGAYGPPDDATFDVLEDAMDEIRKSDHPNHFLSHIIDAFIGLEWNFGWSENRVPLVAYFDPASARGEAINILHRASDHLLFDDPDAANILLCKSADVVGQAVDHPNFQLTLDK